MNPHDSVRSLPGLLEAVQVARRHLAEQRSAERPSGAQVQAARAALLVALEEYASALQDAGRPIPYKMRDEIQLGRETGTTHYR